MTESVSITPLWERLPSAFGYGLRSSPLMLAAILAVGGMFGLYYISLWVQVLIYAVMFKYAFAVLQHTADGHHKPPGLGWETIVEGYELPFKFVAILLFVVLLIVSLGSKGGGFPALFVLVFAAVALPACIMVLAQTSSLLSAINPLLLVQIIGRIGWSYLVLLVFSLLLGMAQAFMEELVLGMDNPWLIYIGYMVIATYFMVVSFHMMGYVLLQSHERLGEDAPAALQREPADQRLDAFQGFMQDGNIDAAIAELEGMLKETPRDLSLHRRMHNLLLLGQKTEQLASHTRRALPFMLEQGHAELAASFYSDCSKQSEECAPRRAHCYAPLANVLRARGESREAALLVNTFNRQFSADDPNKPEFYLAVARILAEDLNQDEQARRLLAVVARTHANHSLIGEVRGYLQTLERLA